MKTKHLFILAALFITSSGKIIAQGNVAINTTGTGPVVSAMLDITSTEKGLLIPRMNTSQRTGIGLPATGLMVYDTDFNQFWYYNGTAWAAVGAGGSGDITDVTAGNGLTGGGTSGNTTLDIGAGTGITVNANDVSLSTTAVTPGSYTATNITVDAYGRITSAANGTVGDITDVVAGNGLTGGSTSGSATIDIGAGTGITVNANDVSLSATSVTPGSYTNSNISVDAYGRITAAANGTSLPAASNAGDIIYWNGTAWVVLPVSNSNLDPSLKLCNGIPTWVNLNGNCPAAYTIGSTGPGGGIVFFDNGNYTAGWRYKEILSADLSAGTQWGCSGTSVGASAGDGMTDTQTIVGGCGSAGIAAELCYNLISGGQSDWYLPSQPELEAAWTALYPTYGSFGAVKYWSSREWNATQAVSVDFSNGGGSIDSKTSSYRVRAVRRF